MPHGRFAWNELNTWDMEAAKRFYAATVGWVFAPMPIAGGLMAGGTYWLAMDGDHPVAGIIGLKSPECDGMPDHWLSYLEVDDVDARAARFAAEGGAVRMPPWDVPGVGRIAIVQADGGSVLGLITSLPQG